MEDAKIWIQIKKQQQEQAMERLQQKFGEKNERIVVLDADLSEATKTNIFAKEFPNRFFDMGIAEQDMLSTAAGLAASRANPICKYFCSSCSWSCI